MFSDLDAVQCLTHFEVSVSTKLAWSLMAGEVGALSLGDFNLGNPSFSSNLDERLAPSSGLAKLASLFFANSCCLSLVWPGALGLSFWFGTKASYASTTPISIMRCLFFAMRAFRSISNLVSDSSASIQSLLECI